MKPSIVLVVLVSLIFVVTAGFEAKWMYTQYQATKLVYEVSGNRSDASAECQRFTQAFLDAQISTLGFVAFSEDNKALIKYTQCQHWGDFVLSDKKNSTIEELVSVGVIIHEGYHVGGEFNEATTQCLTEKNYSYWLTSLGVPEDKVPEYTNKYLETTKNMPAEYLNGVC